RLKSEASPAPGRAMRVAVGALCAVVTVALVAIVLTLPEPAPSLAPLAAEHLAKTQLGNPVTAVLLAYRALDTLLEIFVLMLALIGVWSLGADRFWGGAPVEWHSGQPAPALAFLARTLPPLGIVFAAYLFWIGADEPGGKFQASTILAAMWLLMVMAGILPMPQTGGRRIRAALAIGPVVFITIGFAGIWLADGFLAYPQGFAKPLIILIEAALAFSIVAALTLLVTGPAEQAPRP
ncbi:MAG TPA: MnhB domain-containing protein, partial [Ancylobacter sp.]